MTFAKFEENRFRIDGEIAENHAILVNLMASIDLLTHQKRKSNFILTVKLKMINQDRMIFDDFSVNFEPIS